MHLKGKARLLGGRIEKKKTQGMGNAYVSQPLVLNGIIFVLTTLVLQQQDLCLSTNNILMIK
jgi:hypothetical protein